MERLLHYVWKYKLYAPAPLATTEGQTLEIIDPGIRNEDAGPDFFNAKIKLDGTVWAGSVEIHEKASDWLLHHHDTDKAYDTIILHVVGESDYQPSRSDGNRIPQIILPVPEKVARSIDWLLHRETAFPCFDVIRQIEPLHLTGWMASLLSERLERKTQEIACLLTHYQNDWNEVFYIILTRNFGFGTNSDAFEQLAKSIPFRCIQKQRNSHTQIEALFFGQAGMLEGANDDRYYRLLQQEYDFLRHKYKLTPVGRHLFKNLRTRPDNFPYLRIAQLATIWVHHDTLFSSLLEAHNLREMKDAFRLSPFVYWD